METKPAVRQTKLPQTFNPANLNNKFRNIQTLEQAIQSSSFALVALKSQFGEQNTVDIITLMIADFSDSVNVTSKMHVDQMKRLAVELYDMYFWLKLADFYLIFKFARRGVYGEFYGVLSAEKVHAWFEDYTSERTAYHEQKSFEHHQESTENFIDQRGTRHDNSPKQIDPNKFIDQHYKKTGE